MVKSDSKWRTVQLYQSHAMEPDNMQKKANVGWSSTPFAFCNSCQKITESLWKPMEKISWKTKSNMA